MHAVTHLLFLEKHREVNQQIHPQVRSNPDYSQKDDAIIPP